MRYTLKMPLGSCQNTNAVGNSVCLSAEQEKKNEKKNDLEF